MASPRASWVLLPAVAGMTEISASEHSSLGGVPLGVAGAEADEVGSAVTTGPTAIPVQLGVADVRDRGLVGSSEDPHEKAMMLMTSTSAPSTMPRRRQ